METLMNDTVMKLTTVQFAITLVLAVSIGSIFGCASNPTEPGSPKITTGTNVDVATQTVSRSGGKITIDRPGDSLDGLTIDVPAGAYSDGRSFHISYAPIT